MKKILRKIITFLLCTFAFTLVWESSGAPIYNVPICSLKDVKSVEKDLAYEISAKNGDFSTSKAKEIYIKNAKEPRKDPYKLTLIKESELYHTRKKYLQTIHDYYLQSKLKNNFWFDLPMRNTLQDVNYKMIVDTMKALPTICDPILELKILGYRPIKIKLFNDDTNSKCISTLFTAINRGCYGYPMSLTLESNVMKITSPILDNFPIWDKDIIFSEASPFIFPIKGTVLTNIIRDKNSENIGGALSIVYGSADNKDLYILKSMGYPADAIKIFANEGGIISRQFRYNVVLGYIYDGMDVISNILKDAKNATKSQKNFVINVTYIKILPYIRSSR